MFILEAHEVASTALMSVPQLQGGAVPQAGGILDWVNTTAGEVKTTISVVLIVVGLIVGILIAATKRSVPGVIMAVVVGGFIAGLGGLIIAFGNMAQQEVAATAPAETAHVLVVDQPQGGLGA